VSRRSSTAPTVWKAVTDTVAIALIKVCLRTLGFGRTFRLIAHMTRSPTVRSPSSADEVDSLARRVALAGAFYPGRARCLEQSLLLHWLLRRAGVKSALRLGVNSFGRGAHAWVEWNGRPLNERGERIEKLTVLPAFQ
jgi:Transglutaminase-like superfamily